MKPTLGRLLDRPREAAVDLDETVQEIFSSSPGLEGFSVTDAGVMLGKREAGRLENGLCLADLTMAPGYAYDYFGEIAVALIDLIEERPEARDLLRGRSFARTLH